jgi:uncharacterized protein
VVIAGDLLTQDRHPCRVTFDELPVAAAWQHSHSRNGFEVARFLPKGSGYEICGSTGAVEKASIWSVQYRIDVDHTWATRRALIRSWQDGSACEVILEADGVGGWRVNGEPDTSLNGCLDVDLESSALTNTLPVHRTNLPVDAQAAAPAAYVAVVDLRVHRLEQSYRRKPDDDSGQRYDYSAPEFDFTAPLHYDRSGLVVDYPGIARRAG